MTRNGLRLHYHCAQLPDANSASLYKRNSMQMKQFKFWPEDGRIDPRTRTVLRWSILMVLALVAFNFAGAWWFWEFTLPAAGVSLGQADVVNGRTQLSWV